MLRHRLQWVEIASRLMHNGSEGQANRLERHCRAKPEIAKPLNRAASAVGSFFRCPD
jgi:hypothetical protein